MQQKVKNSAQRPLMINSTFIFGVFTGSVLLFVLLKDLIHFTQ